MDIETRRKKQQTMMVQLVERKVRTRAKQLYETRGQQDGQELQDWFQAESEVLDKNAVAPLYRRLRTETQEIQENASQANTSAQDPTTCESNA
ncbi:MAG TPA: DUF2934 domain-containing protein [Candidatus Binatus sp.]|nr:DUF2934 domain-containing protein [Candidatus Binatus sp.]